MKNQRKTKVFTKFRASLNQLKYEKTMKTNVFRRFRAGLNQLKYEKTIEN